MNIPNPITSNWPVVKKVLWWSLLTIPSAFIIGNVIALLLWSIDRVTFFRILHPQIIWLLPLAGTAIYFIIKACRDTSSNIVLQNIHESDNGVTEKSSFPVFCTTVITHLFGGSAGREGSSLQIGASLSRLSARVFKLRDAELKVVCTSGIAAAFGAVFGVPVAGAFFALEIMREGSFPYNALIPCLVASLVATLTCNYWGVHLTQFQYIFSSRIHPMFSDKFNLDPILMLKSGIVGLLIGLLCCFFYLALQYGKRLSDRLRVPKWAIPFLGGVILVLLYLAFGTQQYLGLGVTGMGQKVVSISSAFTLGGADAWSWLVKSLFVVITLSFGFRGGEITPLLFIGTTLGSMLALLFNAPVALFACLGFIAILSGSANAPFACIILGVELFGSEYITYYAFACIIAYFLSPTRKQIKSMQFPMLPKIFDRAYLNDLALDIKETNRRLKKEESDIDLLN